MGECAQVESLRGVQPPAALSGAGACNWTSPAWHYRPSYVGVVPLVTSGATHRPALLPSWDYHSRLAPPCSCPSLPHTSPAVGMGNHSEGVGVHVGTVPSCGSGTASYVVWSYNPWPVPRG